MGKIISSLRNFAHLASVHGYDSIGITTNEIAGVSASMAFEVPVRTAAPQCPAADEELPSGDQQGCNGWIKTISSPAGQEVLKRPSAVLN